LTIQTTLFIRRDIWPHHDDTLQRELKVTIIVAYASIKDKSDAEKDTFYEDLQICIHNAPPQNILILASNLSARLGPDSYSINPCSIGKYT
jgi:hypothetical protein